MSMLPSGPPIQPVPKAATCSSACGELFSLLTCHSRMTLRTRTSSRMNGLTTFLGNPQVHDTVLYTMIITAFFGAIRRIKAPENWWQIIWNFLMIGALDSGA